jgi:hypothetical protein
MQFKIHPKAMGLFGSCFGCVKFFVFLRFRVYQVSCAFKLFLDSTDGVSALTFSEGYIFSG